MSVSTFLSVYLKNYSETSKTVSKISCESLLHHTNFIRNDDVSFCTCQNIFNCISRCNFAENETFRCYFKVTSLSNDICDALITCQRQCAFFENLGLTVLLAVISCNDNLLDTGTEVHSAPIPGTSLPGIVQLAMLPS